MNAAATLPSTEVDLASARRFLDLLAGSEAVTFQCFDDRGEDRTLARILHGHIEEHAAALRRLNEAGAGIFWVPNRLDGRGRRAQNVVGIRAVFLDLDGAPLAPVAEAPAPPHAIIESSPGRYHAYWLVADCKLEQFAGLQKALAMKFGGDPSVHDLPRCMRLPGFVHRKAAPFVSRLLQANPAPPFAAVDLVRRLGLPECRAEPQGARAASAGGLVPAGGRNRALASLGGGLRRLGLSAHAIDAALQRVNNECCTPPLAPEEVSRVACSVARYPAGEPPAAPADEAQPVDIFRTVTAPALDPGDFPALLQDLAVPLAKAAGHDVGAYLMASLVAGAAATSDALRLMIDPDTSWFESARLWVLLLGAPGTAKTPAIRAGMAPLFELHRQLVERHEATLAALGEDEPKPPRPAIFTTDPTVEALSDVLVANPRGVIAVFEELDSWLGSHDAYRNGGGSKDRGEWLRLFDGGPHQVDRVKRGSVFVQNWGVSIVGATTPAGLKRHAKALPPDGLIQRFLPVLVRPMGTPTATPGERECIEPCRRRLAERMVELFHAPTGVVRLAPDAARMFAERRNQLRAEVEAAAAFSEPFAGHVAKHAGLIARVALTMHAITHGAAAHETLLDAETMRGAIALVRKLTRHALAMFDLLGGGDDGALAVARAAARSIVAGALTEIKRSDLIRTCSQFRGAPDAVKEAALRFLVDAAWLTPLDGSRQYAGRATGYVVHPAVHVKFAAEGEELKARRAVVRELLAG
ncbi:DUF3987 domain-containing protein [Azohydromonas sediminis]|uniref:DUF3987 domain-containing protein n=1 Tax=Azohydromonas sediminis TaxID=2259674 RepID=UPI000E657063|nr:DUF3987 domain-containing protein [Azohydromonas sediminis]